MPSFNARQIDPLVYELCELTEEEIRIIEEATQRSVPSRFQSGSGSGPSALESDANHPRAGRSRSQY